MDFFVQGQCGKETGNGKSCLQLTRLLLVLPVNTRGKGVPKGRGL